MGDIFADIWAQATPASKFFGSPKKSSGPGFDIEWYADDIEQYVRQAVEVATKEGAEIVAAEARRLAPVGTEKHTRLNMQIDVRPSKFVDGGYSVYAQGPGNYDRFYAAFVELGTPRKTTKRDKQPHPFLRPALRKNKRKIKQLFDDAIADKLK